MLNFDPTVDARLGIPTSLYDASGMRLLVGDGYARLLGRGKDELLGGLWQNIAHKANFTDIEQRWRRLVETGVPYSTPWRILRADGSWFTGCFSVSRILTAQTKAAVFQGNVVIDSDAQSEAEARPDDLACADFIWTTAAELSRMARGHKMRLLEHLLSMASQEALNEVERRLGQDHAAAGDPSRTFH